MRTAQKRTISDVAVNFLLDIGITIAVLLLMAEKLTGQAIHEWLGLGFAVALIVHLLLHWDWVVGTTKRLLHKMAGQVRLKYLVNVVIFVDMVIMITTGLLISEVVMRPFNIEVGGFWKILHVFSANLIIWLVALHVALSWKWIVNAVKRYVTEPISHFAGRKTIAAHS